MRILVGRDLNEHLRRQRGGQWYAQRILWFAEDGDVVVLPGAHDPSYLGYIASLTGTDPDTLSVVVPDGDGALTAGRLLDEGTVAKVREAMGGRAASRITTLWPDATTSAFAEAIGAPEAFPGARFFAQGGDLIANSKAMFRLFAAGGGVPIAPGAVCVDRAEAERAVMSILDRGEPAILKNEFLSGGWGNEIVTGGRLVTPLGAHRMTALTDRSGVRAYLEERWAALSANGAQRVVVEQYILDSKTVFAEYTITDEGFSLGAIGGLVPDLFDAPAQLFPAQGLPDQAEAELLAGAGALCDVLHRVGYRGIMSPDAILTPDQRIVFTEFNGRFTGSTHTYSVIGHKVVGADFETTLRS